MIVLVTGAAGFIGSNLIDHLLSNGDHVIGVDNFSTGKRENLSRALESKRFNLVEADISTQNLANISSEKIEIVFHLAAVSSVKQSLEDPALVNGTNVTGTVNVLELARRMDVERIIFTSSAAVYGNPRTMPILEDYPLVPLSPYAASKIAAEQYVQSYNRAYGLNSTILRYFNVYGPRQAYSEYSGVISIFINKALRNQPLVIEGTGKNTRSFIYIDDIIRATLSATQKKRAVGLTINLSGPDSVSIEELAHVIRGTVNSTRSEIVYGDARLGDVEHSIGSMQRAREILDFTPEISLDTGLQRTVDWYTEYLTAK